MLSFREGFRRMRQEKEGTLDPKELEVENIQKKIFEYYKQKEFSDFLKEKTLVFSTIDNTVLVREVESNQKKVLFIHRVPGSTRNIHVVLLFLKQKFINEGYVVLPYKCPDDAYCVNDQGFLVKINLNE